MGALVFPIAIFMAIWFGFFLHVGSELPRSLGGVFVFYFLLPLIASLPLRYREFTGVLWSIALTLSGVVALSYLYWLSPDVLESFHPFVQSCLIITPFMIIEFGFVGTLMSFLVPRTTQNETHFYSFARLISFLWMLPVYATALGMITFESLGLNRIFQLTYGTGLAALIVGRLVFIMKLRRFNLKMLRSATKPALRLRLNPAMFRRNVVLWTTILIFFSFSAEHLRKSWALWAELTVFLILFVAIITRFGQSLCMDISEQIESSGRILLPGMSTRPFVLLFVAAFVIFMVGQVLIAIYR